jgi:hypothetical protein
MLSRLRFRPPRLSHSESRRPSVPCRPGTPTYKIQVKTSSRACIHVLPHALWLRTSWILDGDRTSPTRARVPAVDVFYIDGGRSRISSSGTSQGAYCRHFLALMVGLFRSPAPTPPKGPPSMFFMLMVGAQGSPSAPPRGPPSIFVSIDGGHSWISSFGTS